LWYFLSRQTNIAFFENTLGLQAPLEEFTFEWRILKDYTKNKLSVFLWSFMQPELEVLSLGSRFTSVSSQRQQ